MRRKHEQWLYHLSDRIKTELYFLEVGKKIIVPEQQGSGAFVGTTRNNTGMAEWIIECLEHPELPRRWVHTHPGFNAFFSGTDEEGARRLHRNVGGVVTARVLGSGDAVHEEII